MKIVIAKVAKSSGRYLLYSSQKRRQSGFSLIEVMVAALILSTAILGVAGLQMLGMKGTQQSFMKTQAMGMIHSMTERMRANQMGVVAGNYTLNSAIFHCPTEEAAMPNCSGGDCSSAQIATIDKVAIVCGYSTALGVRTGGVKTTSTNDNVTLANGTMTVACVDCPLGDIRIQIAWDKRAFDEEAPVPDTIIINTRIGAP